MYQKLSFNYIEQKGFKLFMVPATYIMAIPAMMFGQGFMVLFGLFMFAIGTAYLYGLFYTIFVNKRVDIKINEEEFIWEIYENDFLVQKACVYNKDIKHIEPYVQYIDGSYNFCKITFTLKDERKIVLEDSLTFSFSQNHLDILYLLELFNYKNENFNEFETSLKNSTYNNFKEKLSMKIFISGVENLFVSFFKSLKKIRKIIVVVFSLVLLNSLINIASLKLGFFDKSFSKIDSTSILNLSLPKGTKKVFFKDKYYYSLYKVENNYFFVKQKEFSLNSSLAVVNSEVNMYKVYSYLEPLSQAEEIFQKIANNGFRELEPWEYVFKSFWLINRKATTLAKKDRKQLLIKYKKYEKKQALEANFAKAKKRMKIEDKKAFFKLNKKEKEQIKKHFAKVYRDLISFYPTKKKLLSSDLKYEKIGSNYELIYFSSFEKKSKEKIPNLYLIKKSGEYINIFPTWAKKKLHSASLEAKKLKQKVSTYEF